jgi:hypothetical protein
MRGRTWPAFGVVAAFLIALPAPERAAAGVDGIGPPRSAAKAQPPMDALAGHAPSPLASRSSAALVFATADLPRTDVPRQWWPYRRTVPTVLGDGVRDSSGVRMYRSGSRLYDHPVGQAQDGISSLESYVLTSDQRYLSQALGDAHRLVNRRVLSRGAWFYPYPFDFSLHSDPANVIHAPWYSAMAQGQALTLFARLYEQTRDPQWLVALRATVASLGLPPTADPRVPFVSWVDADGRLWLEECARLPLTRSDRTVNGHLFAMFGLWDAARVTSSPQAIRLFRGAAATIRSYVYAGVRRPFGISAYCLTHQVLDPKYHLTVVKELAFMNALTGHNDWADFADRLRDDYAAPHVVGTVVMAGGTVTGYRFGADGTVLGRKTLHLRTWSAAPSNQRERVRGRGYHYRITAGKLAGYEVPEAYPAVWLRRIWAQVTYPYRRLVTFQPGAVTTYVVNPATGTLRSVRRASVRAQTSAHFDRSAWVNGRRFVHVVDGWFAARWVPAQGLLLR